MQIFSGKITNSTEAEALGALQYIQTNQGADTDYATFNSNNLQIWFRIHKNTFNEAQTMIQAFKNQFNVRLVDWKFQYKA